MKCTNTWNSKCWLPVLRASHRRYIINIFCFVFDSTLAHAIGMQNIIHQTSKNSLKVNTCYIETRGEGAHDKMSRYARGITDDCGVMENWWERKKKKMKCIRNELTILPIFTKWNSKRCPQLCYSDILASFSCRAKQRNYHENKINNLKSKVIYLRRSKQKTKKKSEAKSNDDDGWRENEATVKVIVQSKQTNNNGITVLDVKNVIM